MKKLSNSTKDVNIAIGSRIQSLRLKHKLSEDDLAKKIGKNRNTVRLYEKGHEPVPVSILDKISGIFGVSTPLIIYGEAVYAEEQRRIEYKKNLTGVIRALIRKMVAVPFKHHLEEYSVKTLYQVMVALDVYVEELTQLEFKDLDSKLKKLKFLKDSDIGSIQGCLKLKIPLVILGLNKEDNSVLLDILDAAGVEVHSSTKKLESRKYITVNLKESEENK